MATTTISTAKTYGIQPAAGYGNLGAFTPAIYAMEVLEKFYLTTAYADIANTR